VKIKKEKDKITMTVAKLPSKTVWGGVLFDHFWNIQGVENMIL